MFHIKSSSFFKRFCIRRITSLTTPASFVLSISISGVFKLESLSVFNVILSTLRSQIGNQQMSMDEIQSKSGKGKAPKVDSQTQKGKGGKQSIFARG